MVGRLVQQQEVRFHEQQPGEFGPHYPAPAELIHVAGEVAFLEAQACQNRLWLRGPVSTPPAASNSSSSLESRAVNSCCSEGSVAIDRASIAAVMRRESAIAS